MWHIALACTAFAPDKLCALPGARAAASPRLQEDGGDDDEGSAFAAFVQQVAGKKLKPGEGAPQRTDVRGLPIRLGGTERDGSLGELRAAANALKSLGDPRAWEAEEVGLACALAFVAASFIWGYATYVRPPDAPEAAQDPRVAECLRFAVGARETRECRALGEEGIF